MNKTIIFMLLCLSIIVNSYTISDNRVKTAQLKKAEKVVSIWENTNKYLQIYLADETGLFYTCELEDKSIVHGRISHPNIANLNEEQKKELREVCIRAMEKVIQ